MMRCTATLLWAAIFIAHDGPVAVADDWPGWRGDGTGISAESNLPIEWDSERNVLWRTALDGEGISSPIVWRDRVFLTAAAPDAGTFRTAWIAVGLVIAAVLFGLTALGWGQRDGYRPVAAPALPRRSLRLIYIVDRLGTSLALFLFLAVLCLMFLDEDFLQPGHRVKPWRWTMSASIIALVAATGLLRIGSLWRPLGAGALVGALAAFLLAAPSRDSSLHSRALIGASLAVALWWCIVFILFRRAAASTHSSWQSTAIKLLGVVVVLSAAAWQFWSIHKLYLRPKTEWLRLVVCVDADTGKVIWRREVFRTGQLRRNPLASYATPTPVTDGSFIIAQFGVGTACLDMDGNIKWKVANEDYADHVRHGAASSPILVNGVAIQATFPETANPDNETEKEKFARLEALDAQTGNILWECCPPGGHDVYNTPYVARYGGAPAIFLVTRGQLLAYSVADGGLLASWSVPVYQPIASVVADENTVYVPSGGQFGSMGVMAVGTESEDDPEGMSHIRWTVKRSTPKIPSPLLYDGALYMVTDEGVASCIDSQTGDTLWKARLDGSYHASVVCGDDKVYFTSTEGTTTVVRACPEYETLSRNSIDERVQASPAICGGKLFIRGEHHLYCIAEPDR